MRTILAIILITPFLVCDPQAGVQSYVITGMGSTTITTPAQADGSIRYDMASVPAGTYAIQVQACNDLWGCSVSSPFGFVKPVLTAPVGLRLGR